MSATDIDMDAITAAAAAALAAPAETAPAGVYEAHSCQTGCGRLATVVLVRLADSDIDILCDVCYLLMAQAIIAAIPDTPAVADTGEVSDNSGDTETSPSAPE